MNKIRFPKNLILLKSILDLDLRRVLRRFGYLLLGGLLSLSANPNTYTYRDGDRDVSVFLNPSLIAELQTGSRYDKNPKVKPVTDKNLKSHIGKGILPKQYRGNYSEVFEETPGGRKMTLPGDILVEFHSNFTESQIKTWLVMRNLEIKEKLEYLPNTYLIKSNPGIESLLLANSLLSQEGVKSAYPNWWREFTKR